MVQFLPAAGVGGFRTLRAVLVAADFDVQDLQRCPEFRLEEVIEDLAPLRFGIFDREPGGFASAADSPDPVEPPAFAHAIDRDRLHRKARNFMSRPSNGPDDLQTGARLACRRFLLSVRKGLHGRLGNELC